MANGLLPFKTPFTAAWWQVVTYMFGVALFSISFLVFLNSEISFVVTDLVGQRQGVGNVVGTLGFADELVAIVACPVWGLVSDRLGVRAVSSIGYGIVGLSLFGTVLVRNVYPQLLLARLFFSVGAAATTTMVTAILPTMTVTPGSSSRRASSSGGGSVAHAGASLAGNASAELPRQPSRQSQSSANSDSTITPSTFASPRLRQRNATDNAELPRASNSHVAGIVGMFTGLGALIALGVFLPLPARFQAGGFNPAQAIAYSFYTVGAIAVFVCLWCDVGLRDLPGEKRKGWRRLFGMKRDPITGIRTPPMPREQTISLPRRFGKALLLVFHDKNIGLGYLGGFVARASSVGVSLFISLYVNSYFIRTGRCDGTPDSNPSDIKNECRRAYILAAELSGVAEVVALLAAPLFGYLDGRIRWMNAPLLLAAAAGVAGYAAFGALPSPEPSGPDGSPWVFAIVALLGFSQIGAIVCSLSMLARGIQATDSTTPASRPTSRAVSHDFGNVEAAAVPVETTRLLRPATPQSTDFRPPPLTDRTYMKGTIAGVYSLAGGAGILLLTKLGGYLFDEVAPGAPFYMLATFNGILLVIGVVVGALGDRLRQHVVSLA